MPLLIRAKGITRTYRVGQREIAVLRDVDLAIEAGEFVAIMGASGSGKSTLLHILGLLDRPSAGRYWLAGRDTAGLDVEQRAALRNRAIGFVFQAYNLLPRSSALENVELPLVYRGGVARRERRARAEAALAEVGLAERADHWPQQLSGGEQQRVAIARALVTEPDLVLADEPTGSVDSAGSEQIMALFRRLHRRGITVVLITHNPSLGDYAGRLVRIRDGRVQEEAPSPDPRVELERRRAAPPGLAAAVAPAARAP